MTDYARTTRLQLRAALLFTCAMTGSPLIAQEAPRPTLRVLTYNIHHGEGTDGRFDYQRVAKIINDLKPDVVALQEVDNKTLRASGVDQAAHLGDLTGMHHVFGLAMPFSGGGYGGAILSRFSMEQAKVHRLPSGPGQEPRIVLSVRIRPGNGLPDFVFAGTHFCHQNDETRREQAEEVNRLFEPRRGPPVILAGDLNARPGSAPMEALLEERWVDAIAPESRIDYVLYRECDPWKVADVQIVDDRVASDHRPVLAILEWHGPRGVPDSDASVAGREGELDFSAWMAPTPASAALSDPDYYIWGGSVIRHSDGLYHMFYSRWKYEDGFNAWVTHSEIAHAVASDPLGPYTHVDVALPARGADSWDGLCTHNPTVHRFDGKYYLYYMGNTGDGKVMKGLNWTHRNSQRIGVAVAEHPNGPWKRFDRPLIDVGSESSEPDSLMVSNPSILRRPDDTFVLIYKAVGQASPLPFGGPVVHLAATSTSPAGPFIKQHRPLFTVPGAEFPAEDPFIWTQQGAMWALVKDFRGTFTGAGPSIALFQSADGLTWAPSTHPLATKTRIVWEETGSQNVHRLERPQLLFDEGGRPIVLFCAVAESGTGDPTYNVHIPLRDPSGQ